MRNIRFLDARAAIADREIRLVEQAFGTDLPSEFREWLGRTNGGLPTAENNFICRETLPEIPTSVRIEEFFDAEQILSVSHDYGRRVPSGFAPIGHDGDGNLVLLGLLDEFRGGVYFWDHENEPAAARLLGTNDHSWDENIYSLANSWSEFLELLGSV